MVKPRDIGGEGRRRRMVKPRQRESWEGRRRMVKPRERERAGKAEEGACVPETPCRYPTTWPSKRLVD